MVAHKICPLEWGYGWVWKSVCLYRKLEDALCVRPWISIFSKIWFYLNSNNSIEECRSSLSFSSWFISPLHFRMYKSILCTWRRGELWITSMRFPPPGKMYISLGIVSESSSCGFDRMDEYVVGSSSDSLHWVTKVAHNVYILSWLFELYARMKLRIFVTHKCKSERKFAYMCLRFLAKIPKLYLIY